MSSAVALAATIVGHAVRRRSYQNDIQNAP